MNQLLLINPNTNDTITTKIAAHISQLMDGNIQINQVTARFGSPYISSEASYAVASHATLDAWTTYTNQHGDSLPTLIGCFGDPGLFALRESSLKPVTGLAEASFLDASRYGDFAVVTGGKAWGPMLNRLALGLAFKSNLIRIHTVDATGADLAADPEAALELLSRACDDVLKHYPAKASVLGGAGLVGYAELIQSRFQVPIIDSVSAGARWALRLVRLDA